MIRGLGRVREAFNRLGIGQASNPSASLPQPDIAVSKPDIQPGPTWIKLENLGAPGQQESKAIQATAQILDKLLPPPLGAILLHHMAPFLAFESERNLSLTGQAAPGSRVQGRLQLLSEQPLDYQVRSEADPPAVSISGDGTNLRLALAQAKRADVPVFRIDGLIGEREVHLELDSGQLRPAGLIMREALPEVGGERWLVDGPFKPYEAKFFRTGGPEESGQNPARQEVVPLLQRYGLFRPLRFQIQPERVNRNGYRFTNEATTDFPSFNIRGGAYLGVGATQNYDHLTTLKAEAAFLVDYDRRVIADHKGLLALVEISQSPAEFLSALAGSPLTTEEKRLPAARMVEVLLSKPENSAFKAEIEERLSASVSPDQIQAARTVLKEGRLFLKQWKNDLSSGTQYLWLADQERFDHLRFLKQSGRIFVRTADLTGEETLRSVADELQKWNQSRFPPLSFTLIYLSNAPGWIAQRLGSKGGLKRLRENLAALPRHPDGVILLTTVGSAKFHPDVRTEMGNWKYVTHPMDLYLEGLKKVRG